MTCQLTALYDWKWDDVDIRKDPSSPCLKLLEAVGTGCSPQSPDEPQHIVAVRVTQKL